MKDTLPASRFRRQNRIDQGEPLDDPSIVGLILCKVMRSQQELRVVPLDIIKRFPSEFRRAKGIDSFDHLRASRRLHSWQQADPSARVFVTELARAALGFCGEQTIEHAEPVMMRWRSPTSRATLSRVSAVTRGNGFMAERLQSSSRRPRLTSIKDRAAALRYGWHKRPKFPIERCKGAEELMAMIFDNASNDMPAPRLGRAWAWLLLLAIFQILGGLLAVAVPIAASFAAVGVIAALLIVTAFLQLMHAFQMKAWPRSAWYGLGALLYAAVGVALILYPVTGALALAVLIAVILIAEGALRTVFGTLLRPLSGWRWLVVAGLLSIIVGVILLIGWPVTALWLTGLLLGANLLVTGIMNAAFAITARSNVSSSVQAV